MIGETIGNHKITGKLGQGGMGTVYEAEDTTLGRKVAIKVLNPSLTGGKELERFESEAKVQASLNHPNIVSLYKFEPIGNSYYMVMEYVEGRTLADLVRSAGALAPHIVVGISKQVLDGLSAAHRRGIVHRDLKPSNIMLTSEGLAKVMDFGIAKVQGGKSLTATGALVGTVFYMSPEQVRGEVVDARSDLYSFGVILFELLTGRVPFKDESDFQIMIHHVQTPPPLPTQLLPNIPAQLEQLVLRCLAKDPAERFQNADEILAALDAFEEQERTAGRGQLYTRRALAQWLAAPEAAPAGPLPEKATVLDQKPVPARATEPMFGTPPPPSAATVADSPPPAASAYTVTPPVPTAFRQQLAAQGPPAPAKKGIVFIVAMLGVVLIAALGAYLYIGRLKSAGGPHTQPTSEPEQAAAVPSAPMQPAAQATIPEATSNSAPAATTGSGADNTAGAAVSTNQVPANATSQAVPGAAPEATPSNPARDSAAPSAFNAATTSGATKPSGSSPSPDRMRVQPVVPRQTGQAGTASRAAETHPAAPPAVANPRTMAAGAGRAPALQGETHAAAVPQGVLIFLDLDQSGERLPLGTAQARVADIVRENGLQVVSSGLVAANVRSALDRRDFAEIRQSGVGYVIMGTAHGSLESQNAYGSTYSAGRAEVSFEMVRMTDGAVAATGSGQAKSRGSANPTAALTEAVLTATSEAARELMRQFKP
jgi:eukaryotic-like serine/threonine-protein kinase